jgi:hypothetical protein
MPDDQQTIEQTERDGGNDEQIDRGDAVGMIAEERLPPLGTADLFAWPCI